MSHSGAAWKLKSKRGASRRALTFVVLCVVVCGHAGGFTGCARPDQRAIHPQAQAAPEAAAWIETQLYFGLGPADHPEHGISETRWRQFLDAEVTPRFPSGLTVADAYGQWQGAGEKTPERLRSKLLIFLHRDTAAESDRIDAVRTAWKKLTGDESVLRVSYPAKVSF